MARYGMVIDLTKCFGCSACTVACKVENQVPMEQYRTKVEKIGPEGKYPNLKMHFFPVQCNHCEEPPCVEACPKSGKATYLNEKGFVRIDEKECIGCGMCLKACLYGARFINTETKKADKCSFCWHRVENGLTTACTNTCTAGARIFGDLDDPNSDIAKFIKTHKVEAFKEQSGTKPKIFYVKP